MNTNLNKATVGNQQSAIEVMGQMKEIKPVYSFPPIKRNIIKDLEICLRRWYTKKPKEGKDSIETHLVQRLVEY